MTAKIIDGKSIAQKIVDNIKEKVQKLDVKPTLSVIIVGENAASKIYVNNKIKRAKEAGFNSFLVKLDEKISKEELLGEIEKLNKDENVNGILLQLPLPKHLSENDFIDRISPNKDVDGFNSFNAGKLFKGINSIIPCTPKGIIKLIDEYKIDTEGKVALVIGRSNIVGKPISVLMSKKNSTVITAHSKTKNLSELAKMSDIIISAAGQKNLITKDMIKEGAVVFDVGIVRDDEGKIRGDVDFEGVKEKASYITPVPGGIGPMTVAELMENTLELYLSQKGA